MQTTPTTTKKLNVPLVIAVVAGGWLAVQVLTAPSQPKGVDLRLQRQQNAQDVAAIQVAEEKARQMAAIADKRYTGNCLLVLSLQNITQGVQIAENVPILDYYTRKPLARGTHVCDTVGNTAVIGNEGKPINIAFTGNRDAINQRLQGVNLKPAQTVQQLQEKPQ